MKSGYGCFCKRCCWNRAQTEIAKFIVENGMKRLITVTALLLILTGLSFSQVSGAFEVDTAVTENGLYLSV